jgi:hypothetical protein
MSKHALQIALGAKQAEVDAALKLQGKLKAQVAALEKKVKASASSLKASFQRIGFNLSDDPSPEQLESARAFLDGYAVKAKQLAQAQAASLGFAPITDEELDACDSK